MDQWIDQWMKGKPEGKTNESMAIIFKPSKPLGQVYSLCGSLAYLYYLTQISQTEFT
jgi:hypothetical protein